MSDSATTHERLEAFTHVNAEKTGLCRAVMRVFTEAKARFGLHLRSQEIVQALAETDNWTASDDVERLDSESVEAALNQLCEWGNLASHPDTTDVGAAHEYSKRFVDRKRLRRGLEAAQLCSLISRGF